MKCLLVADYRPVFGEECGYFVFALMVSVALNACHGSTGLTMTSYVERRCLPVAGFNAILGERVGCFFICFGAMEIMDRGFCLVRVIVVGIF